MRVRQAVQASSPTFKKNTSTTGSTESSAIFAEERAVHEAIMDDAYRSLL